MKKSGSVLQFLALGLLSDCVKMTMNDFQNQKVSPFGNRLTSFLHFSISVGVMARMNTTTNLENASVKGSTIVVRFLTMTLDNP